MPRGEFRFASNLTKAKYFRLGISVLRSALFKSPKRLNHPATTRSLTFKANWILGAATDSFEACKHVSRPRLFL